jgi:hypothetical protein
VREAELRARQVGVAEVAEEGDKVRADAAQQLADRLVGDARDAGRLLDGAAELGLKDAELVLGLLDVLGLGQVGLEEVAQLVGEVGLGDGVDLLERVGGAAKRLERDELGELAKALELAGVFVLFGGRFFCCACVCVCVCVSS